MPVIVPSRLFTVVGPQSHQQNRIIEAIKLLDELHGIAIPRLETSLLLREPAFVAIQDCNFRHRRGILVDEDMEAVYEHIHSPPMIIVSDSTQITELATWHEVGHFWDHLVLSYSSAFVSRTSRLDTINEWKRIVRKSALYRTIEHTYDTVSTAEKRAIESYFLEPAELWACSYAQYVAESLGADAYRWQLDRFRHPNDPLPRHWNAEDFQPIRRAVDDILRGVGWI